jgi:spermidine/putrescine-binding protein
MIYKNEFIITFGEDKAIKKLKKSNNTQLSNLMIQFFWNDFCIAKNSATFKTAAQKEYYKQFMKKMMKSHPLVI